MKSATVLLALVVVLTLFSLTAFAVPPSYGTIIGNTWTDTFSPPELPSFSVSVTPVPEAAEKGFSEILSMQRGSILTVSCTEVEMQLEIWVITEFDDSPMAEHEVRGPIFTGESYTFDESGLYSVWIKRGSSYSASLVIEIKPTAAN